MPLRWLENRLFLGEVIQDYGVIEERSYGIGRKRVSLILSRKDGEPVLVIKESLVFFLGISIRYTYVQSSQIARFREIIEDVYQRIQIMKDYDGA